MWSFLPVLVTDTVSIPYTSLWLSIFCLMCGLGHWFVLNCMKARKKRFQNLENFPGPPTLPFLGSAHLLNVENHELFQFCDTQINVYGKLSKIWLFHKPYVLIADANVVEKILTSKLCLDKGDDMKVFRPWWGTGLLTATASKWKSQRKLLNHTFSHSVLVEFLEIFNKESFLLQDRLRKYSDAEKVFNVIPLLTATTLNIICETAMGKKLVSEGETNQEYIDAVTGMYYILVARMTRPWLRPDFVWKFTSYGRREKKYLKILHGFTEKVIEEKRQLRKSGSQIKVVDQENNIEGKKSRRAFMDYLLDFSDNGHELSNLDIRNEVDTFMAAGHDTTAFTVGWTLFLLATYPEHQQKVQNELDLLFDNDETKPVTALDLSKMTYLNLCIKEALRIYPLVPFNFRKVAEDIKCDETRTIPSGTNVVIMPYVLHKDPEYFHEPKEFQPERFLAENCHNRHPFAYIPFSLGPRNCIGQKFGMNEAKVILSFLLRSYTFTTTDSRESIKLDLDLVTRPMNGLNFKITKR